VRASMPYQLIIRLTCLALAPVQSRRTVPAAAMPDNNSVCDLFCITLSVKRAFMGQSVTAPSEALETFRAYFANTPFVA
jgi:hypothetical protein